MESVKIKNIIFDLGNTLVYFDHNCFFDGVARIERKFNVNHFRDYIRNTEIDVKLATSKINHIEFYNILKKKFNLKISYHDLIYIHSNIFWENKSMKKYLSKICKIKGIKLFMLSNTDSAHMKFINENFPYLDVIKKRVLSYKVNMLKPDKRIFNYLLNEYKIKSQETLFIDDLKDNVIAAESVGINSIQYTTHESFLKQINEFVKI